MPNGAIHLRDYQFVDDARLDSYISQVGGMPLRPAKRSRKLTISPINPSFEMVSEYNAIEPTADEKITFLWKKLFSSGNMIIGRPIEAPPHDGAIDRLVFEQARVRIVAIPGDRLPEELRIKVFKIWVSDPEDADLNGSQWSYRGSYLYLTQIIFDDIGFQNTISGCSALRAIINIAQGNEMLSRGHQEMYGRDDNRHPVEKLSDIGGIELSSHKIEVLYRARYMTNEQLFRSGGKNHRVHDVLGYPVYIANA